MEPKDTPVRPSLLSDAELRRAKLILSDPYQQDLVWEIPPGVHLIEILNTYAFERYPEEKAKCIDCNKRQHKYGFTALLSDHSLVLLGSSCGKNIFGESWKQAANRLSERRRRQFMLNKLDEILPKLPQITAELRKWLRECCRLDASHMRFKKTMADLYSLLSQSAVNDNGQLMLYERVRDLAAEHRRDERQQKEGPPIYTWQVRLDYVLKGAAYFSVTNAEERVRQAIELLERIEEAARATEQFKTREMRKLRNEMQKCTDFLWQVAAVNRGIFAFFEPINLQSVARWATASNRIDGTYSSKGGVITCESDGVKMTLPPNIGRLDTSVLQLITRTWSDRSAA